LKATVHHGTIRLPEVRFVLLGCRNGKVRPPAGGYVFVCACRGNAIGNSSRPEDLFATLAHLNMSGHTYAFAVVPVLFVSGPAVAPTASPTPGYPSGAFQWCPDPRGTLPFGKNAPKQAAHAALRFSRAFLKRKGKALARLADPAARPHLGDPVWGITGDPRKIGDTSSGPARHDSLVIFGCGPDVAARAWEVTVDDGTSSASLDFAVYLVLRSDGWKVWGSY
jgi:hypothetical protein